MGKFGVLRQANWSIAEQGGVHQRQLVRDFRPKIHVGEEIAFHLGLSSKTVDVHRARVMERLGIADVAGLTRYALRNRLIAA